MRSSDRAVAAAAGIGTAVLLAFVLLPVVAIFVRVPPSTLFKQMHSGVALDALLVTAKTSSLSLLLILALGTPAAYLLAGASERWAPALTTILELPLVLPPAVAGIGLLVAFGRAGLLGGVLRAFGVSLPFTQVAVVMAMTFVALPLYVRQAIASFESLDPQLLAASRSLGAGPGATFALVAVPMSAPGLSAGAALAWARALGEFGATLIFAGSFQGRTQTLSLAIYAGLQSDFDVALALAALLVALSGGVLVGVKLLLRAPSTGSRNAPRTPWTELPSLPSTSPTA
jgi:molybdate transport system permease protein